MSRKRTLFDPKSVPTFRAAFSDLSEKTLRQPAHPAFSQAERSKSIPISH